MKLRLDKMLSNMGIGTRREVKQLIKLSRVSINGVAAKSSSDYVNTDRDEVKVDGERVEFRENIYLMLNKPGGYVSATEDSRDATVIDLVPEEFSHYNLFPVGRLDKDTEGLLLLTNDGKLAYNLLSPKKHVDKTYYVVLSESLKEGYFSEFERGVELEDGYITMPAKLEAISGEGNKCYLTIREGKFHQVKRMFESLGNSVTYLKRISMGSLTLDEELEMGHVRELTDKELENLIKI